MPQSTIFLNEDAIERIRDLTKRLKDLGVTWRDKANRIRRPSVQWVIYQMADQGLTHVDPWNDPKPAGSGRTTIIPMTEELVQEADLVFSKSPARGWSRCMVLRRAILMVLPDFERAAFAADRAPPGFACIGGPAPYKPTEAELAAKLPWTPSSEPYADPITKSFVR